MENGHSDTEDMLFDGQFWILTFDFLFFFLNYFGVQSPRILWSSMMKQTGLRALFLLSMHSILFNTGQNLGFPKENDRVSLAIFTSGRERRVILGLGK